MSGGEDDFVDMIAAAIQFAIGLVLALYGVFTLLQAKRQQKGPVLLAFVCMLVGIFLAGYGVLQYCGM